MRTATHAVPCFTLIRYISGVFTVMFTFVLVTAETTTCSHPDCV